MLLVAQKTASFPLLELESVPKAQNQKYLSLFWSCEIESRPYAENIVKESQQQRGLERKIALARLFSVKHCWND